MTDKIELYSIQHYPAGTGITSSREGMSRAAVILRKKPKDVPQSEKAHTTYNDSKGGFYLKGRCVLCIPGSRRYLQLGADDGNERSSMLLHAISTNEYLV